MSMQAITYAMTRDAGKMRDQFALHTIAHHVSNDSGTCYAGQKLLAREMKCSETTIKEALKSLEISELISRTPRHAESGRRTTDTIELTGFMSWLEMIEGKGRKPTPYRDGSQSDGGRVGRVTGDGSAARPPRTGLKTKSTTVDSATVRDAPEGGSGLVALKGDIGGIAIWPTHPLYDFVTKHPLVSGNNWLLKQHKDRRPLTLTGVTEEALEEIQASSARLTDRSLAMAGEKE